MWIQWRHLGDVEHVARTTVRNGYISITCRVYPSEKRNEKQTARPFHKTHKLQKTQTAPVINSSHRRLIAYIRRKMPNRHREPKLRLKRDPWWKALSRNCVRQPMGMPLWVVQSSDGFEWPTQMIKTTLYNQSKHKCVFTQTVLISGWTIHHQTQVQVREAGKMRLAMHSYDLYSHSCEI